MITTKFITCSALRSKFSQERRDVFPPPSLRESEISGEELRKLIRKQSEDLKFIERLAKESPPTPPANNPPDPKDDFEP